MAKDKALWIDCVAGSQLRDTQGEMLSVEGADITDLQAGKGRWNDNHGKGFFNSLGTITEAKKIFKAEDCDNDRHKYYWDKIKAPYVYAAGYLYNDEDHQNAKAAAAILRNIHKKDSPLKLKASVEGGVVARGIRDETLLAQTKIHSVALTFTPANQATLVEPTSLQKSSPEPGDEELIKSVMHLAQENVPSFRHIVRHGSATRIHDNLHKIAELTKLIKGSDSDINIPTSKEILESAIEAKIAKNVDKIHKAIVNEEDLNKGVKSAIAGAAAAGMIAASPGQISTEKPVPKQASTEISSEQSHEEGISNLKKDHPHLWALAHVESSGGKNLKHEKIDSSKSMHTGHTAGGPWGLMPHTVQYANSISKDLRSRHPEVAKMAKDSSSVKDNHKEITKHMNDNPDSALDYANTLYNKLHKVHNGDKDKIAHSWYHGIGGTRKAIKAGKDISKHDYVKKFNNLLEHGDKRGDVKNLLKSDVEKALTAGYGGAAAPTGRVHGAVIQSESLEDGRDHKGFKYAVCDSCGEEQIYSKHQVKCRKCNKSWSLEKLFRFM